MSGDLLGGDATVTINGERLRGRWSITLGGVRMAVRVVSVAVATAPAERLGPVTMDELAQAQRLWPVDLRRPSLTPPTYRGPQVSRRGSHKQNRRKATR